MRLKGLGCRTQGSHDPTPPPSLDMFAEEVTEGELETPTPTHREGKKGTRGAVWAGDRVLEAQVSSLF